MLCSVTRHYFDSYAASPERYPQPSVARDRFHEKIKNVFVTSCGRALAAIGSMARRLLQHAFEATWLLGEPRAGRTAVTRSHTTSSQRSGGDSAENEPENRGGDSNMAKK